MQILKVTESVTDFGKVLYYSMKQFEFALYRYSDESDIIYLANVKVFEEYRGRGFGNLLLNVARSEAFKFGARILCLKCNPCLWVYEWYLRKGFKYLKYDEKTKFVWLKYDLT